MPSKVPAFNFRRPLVKTYNKNRDQIDFKYRFQISFKFNRIKLVVATKGDESGKARINRD
jgi:hypothetical protein